MEEFFTTRKVNKIISDDEFASFKRETSEMREFSSQTLGELSPSHLPTNKRRTERARLRVFLAANDDDDIM